MWSQSFLASLHFSAPPKLSLVSPSSSSSSCFHHKFHKRILCFTQNPSSKTEINLSKRHLNLSILTLFFNGFFLLDKAKSIEELQRYTDSNNGFTLLIPSSYTKVEKAGANALFEEPNNGSNNIGVVVSPVRIKSLDQFGTPQFVADKLINAEKRKVIKRKQQQDFLYKCVCDLVLVLVVVELGKYKGSRSCVSGREIRTRTTSV